MVLGDLGLCMRICIRSTETIFFVRISSRDLEKLIGFVSVHVSVGKWESRWLFPNRERRLYMQYTIAWWWLCVVGRGQELKGQKEETVINERLKKKVTGWILDKAKVNTTLLKCQENLGKTFSTFSNYNVDFFFHLGSFTSCGCLCVQV